MNSLWKNQILDDYRNKKKTVDEIAKSYGYSVDEVTKVIFPTGRKLISEAIVDRRPAPMYPVKAGLSVIEGKKPKDQKWVEAGKKAHAKRIENLARAAMGLPPLPKAIPAPKKVKEQKLLENIFGKEITEPQKPASHPETTNKELHIPMEINGQKLNRKQRRLLAKKAKEENLTPYEVVANTIAQFTKGIKSEPVLIKEKSKKEKIIELLEQAIKLLKEDDEPGSKKRGKF